MRRRILVAIAWTVAATVAAALVRYLAIQPHAIGHLCRAADAPLWCAVRQGVVLAFGFEAFGLAALGCGFVAMVRGGAGWSGAAMALGGAALVLYNADFGAVGFLLGLVRLARLDGRPARA